MQIHDSLETGDTDTFSADQWDVTSDFLYLGNRNHIRRYSGIERGVSRTRQSAPSVSAHC